MTVIDPSGFSIAVQLRTNRGVFPFRTGGARALSEDLQVGPFVQSIFLDETDQGKYQDLNIVQSVELDIGLGCNGSISAQIAAPFDMGLALLNSELFRNGNFIEVQLGYPRAGKFLPWFSGLTTTPDIDIDPESGLTGTLKGQGAAFSAQRNSRPTVWEGRSYIDIIRDLASRSHNQWRMQFPEQDGNDDPFYVTRASVSQGNKTDWLLVRQICQLARCAPFISYEHDNSRPLLIVRRMDDMLGQKPTYTFMMRGQIDCVSRFPLYKFTSSSEGIWLPRGTVAIVSMDWNADTLEEDEATVTREQRREETPALRDGDVAGGASQMPDSDEVAALADEEPAVITTSSRDSSRTPTETATMAQDDAINRGGITGTATSMGLTDLFPGDMIRIEGMGLYDGNYLCRAVKHSASEGSWDMEMQLLVNSPGGQNAINDALSSFLNNVNTQESDEQPESGSGAEVDRQTEGTE